MTDEFAVAAIIDRMIADSSVILADPPPAMIPVGPLGEPPRPPRWVKSHAAGAVFA